MKNNSLSSDCVVLDKKNPVVAKIEYEDLKFSAHAVKRLEARNIILGISDLLKIKMAVDKALLKGSKESLVILDSSAMVVNILNKTVITAVPVFDGKDNMFTNIDSVIFACWKFV